MIKPQPAPVKPRVVTPAGNLPLEELIREKIQTRRPFVVQLSGPTGSGKTTALRHLAAVFPEESLLLFRDDPPLEELLKVAKRGTLVFAFGILNQYLADSFKQLLSLKRVASDPIHEGTISYLKQSLPPGIEADLTVCHMAPWGQDEWIEYLLACHKDECGAVMNRLESARYQELLAGSPRLWRIVLDAFAADPMLTDIREALLVYLRSHCRDEKEWEQVGKGAEWYLRKVFTEHKEAADWPLARPSMDLYRLLQHRAIQYLAAAENIRQDLKRGVTPNCFALMLPPTLLEMVADGIRADQACLDFLQGLLGGPAMDHPTTASLLHLAIPDWRPQAQFQLTLNGASFSSANWALLDYVGGDLNLVDLDNATLYGANLELVQAVGANFTGADLRSACLDLADFETACFERANLSKATAKQAHFYRARLKGANFQQADCSEASFWKADLRDANFQGAKLCLADLTSAVVEGADFTGADFSRADLPEVELTNCTLTDAIFPQACLLKCNLEGLEVPNARFENADLRRASLTGSVMRGANFIKARLCQAGLAEIDWEGASLCGADFNRASFHLGTTREGMLFTPIACEGSRTGYYTDEYCEQYFKSPEDIRKANLCGADLRGAKVEKADFYLVDLRGARFDASQREHFRRCGAILSPP